MLTKWRMRTVAIATLGIGSVTANCGMPTGPAVVSPTAMQVEPLQLQLAVGDTGQIRVVLRNGSDTIRVDARMEGGVVLDYQFDPLYGGMWNGQFSRIVKQTYAAKTTIYWIEALAPGTETLGVFYGKDGPCPDLPECLLTRWMDLLPEQVVVIAVH